MRRLLLLPVLAGLAGCATPLPEHHARVPFIAQENGHCGEAALAMILRFHGRPVDPARLRARLDLPALSGTASPLIAAEARDEGLPARVTTFATPDEAGVGITLPMIALLGPFDEQGTGHYVVVTGYRSGKWVEFHSGNLPDQRLPWRIFMDKWALAEYEGVRFDP
ncbi:MAG: cysteine peptidase family C39 domain-containing protein [Kiritimatiellia bacterium]